jgi:hypothetical protein
MTNSDATSLTVTRWFSRIMFSTAAMLSSVKNIDDQLDATITIY